ncbi:transporter, CPA2 family [Coleofasciculus chthonoplastes PCC 7420]|uniref:Transporter, CPA2 family n=1 Tax=Coleofasciculus chthonoplastes PCC 7420 TaxID=118168 RepID=B4VTB8_9CYAN|nr:cation:proton antiporter [Coleofasciculus chthonoplastes]EDX74847.1 transporter, CPA2 family [Coleofasciculus chthonoplastes PCC 7420]
MNSVHHPLLTAEIEILVLLLVACLGAVTFKRLHFPYTVGLVIIGFIFGLLTQTGLPLETLNALTLSPELILYAFVPPLIFESAINLDNRVLLKTLTPALILAGPGLLVSVVIVGGTLSWLTPLSLGGALLFGTLISATDPVAVISLFKEFGVPKRLTMLVEGESMLNDATAIVMFDLVIAAIAAQEFGVDTVEQGSVNVFVVLGGGLLVGAVTASIMDYAIAQARRNPLIQTTVTVVVAYAAFIVADHFFHVSGVISVMMAGLVVGRYMNHSLTPEVRRYLHEFWEYAAFITNSLIFLLVGINTAGFTFRIEIGSVGLWQSVAWAIVAAIVARAVVVFGLTPISNWLQRKTEPIGWRFQVVTFWGGLRGAVALALALSLPGTFPNRELIIAMTLGVALFTILVSGSTMGTVIHRLKLDEPPIFDSLGKVQATVLAKREVLRFLHKLNEVDLFEEEVIQDLRQDYEQALLRAETEVKAIWEDLKANPELVQVFWLQGLAIEQQTYQDLYDQGLLSESVLRKLNLIIEAKRDDVLENKIPPKIPSMWVLKTPLETLAMKYLQHFAVGRRWCNQRRLWRLKVRYEYYAATAYVCRKVAQRIYDLEEEQAVDPLIAGDFIQFYQSKSERAFHQLSVMGTNRHELAIALQTQVANHVVHISEEEVFEKLVSEGIVSESALDDIRALIEMESR